MTDLERFQRTFLALLASSPSAEEATAALRAHPDAAPYADWLADLEPRMVEVAWRLVRRWGRRDDEEVANAPGER